MTEYCSNCGEPLEPEEEEEGICYNCKNTYMQSQGPPLDPNDVSYQ